MPNQEGGAQDRLAGGDVFGPEGTDRQIHGGGLSGPASAGTAE
jgi:hypothetical protein